MKGSGPRCGPFLNRIASALGAPKARGLGATTATVVDDVTGAGVWSLDDVLGVGIVSVQAVTG